MIASATLVVNASMGIHARPAAFFVKTASRHSCEIMLTKGGETVNGKSIMGLMMLAMGPGTVFTATANGHDAAEAICSLSDAADYGFGDYTRRIDDIYWTWEDEATSDHSTFKRLQQSFETAEARLEFNRFCIGDLPEQYGVTKEIAGVLAVIHGVYIFDESFVIRQRLRGKQCSELVGGAPFIVYGHLRPYCACIDIVNTFDTMIASEIVNGFYKRRKNQTLSAIAFELLHRKGAIYSEEMIALCQSNCNYLTMAALLRLVDDCSNVQTHVRELVTTLGTESLLTLARSAASVFKHSAIHTALQNRLFAEPQSFVRYVLADATTCVLQGSLEVSLTVLERLLADTDPVIRWRAANALTKIYQMGHTVPNCLIELALNDGDALVRHQAHRMVDGGSLHVT